jgi:uncharacterized repeat protein (TIGR01451 family)
MPKLYTAVLLMLSAFTSFFSTSCFAQTFTNRGKDFWVGYQATALPSEMRVYLTAMSTASTVKVAIGEGTPNEWIRIYSVPANTTVESDIIPVSGAQDARLVGDGLYLHKGIHITSSTAISAYAHIYASANSGASMLLPSGVLGSENYILTARQNYSSSAYSVFHVIATEDSTWVEINPSKPTIGGWTPNAGSQSNGSYLVKLNKGDAYQVLGAIISGSEGYDLTGSTVKSIPNNQGIKHPVAVFAGSTRTGIGCGNSTSSSGDIIFQQVTPYQSWGTRFAVAPFTNNTTLSPAANMTCIYRVMVKDPTTVVVRNGAVLTNLVNGLYYQYESSTADQISSDKPVLLAQYMASNGGCPNTGGTGDPEMIYLTPLSHAISQTVFYRTTTWDIRLNFMTLVVPSTGLGSLYIDGVLLANIPAADKFSYSHPNMPGYSVVVRKWTAAKATCTVSCNMAFTGTTYGLGIVESYGYNIGAQFDSANLQSIRYNTIAASFFTDANLNGIKDANENLMIQARMETIKRGVDTFSTITSTGNFLLYVDTGNYVSRVIPNSPYYNVVPATRSSSFSTYFNTDTAVFALQPQAGRRDFAVNLTSMSRARPGFDVVYKVFYQNNGTDTADATINIVKSSKLVFKTASVVPAYNNADTIRWTIPAVQPNQSGVINVTLSVIPPPTVAIGDTIRTTATISTTATDLTPMDNTAKLQQRVVGSYDPNEKSESHAGAVKLSEAMGGEYLQYTILFQNTGNDTAFTVVVRDTIDAKLDWSTFKMVSSSHNYLVNMNDERNVAWTFNNIQLVDSFRNEPLSHGYITYVIKTKNTVSAGDVIANKASIYFDHNVPIVTNTEITNIVTEQLPLTLLSFTATKQGNENVLAWRTAQEINFSHCEVERSTSGRDFMRIATVTGGLNAYRFADATFKRTMNYYRLKLVDKDGRFEYSPARKINNTGNYEVSIYPNPVKETLQLRIDSDVDIQAQVQVLALDGRVIITQKLAVNSGATIANINTTQLPKGSYIVKIISSGGVIINKFERQ